MATRPRDKFLRHEACPNCGEDDRGRDNLSVYASGFKHCESCGKSYPVGSEEGVIADTMPLPPTNAADFLTLKYKALDKRMLTAATAQRYCYGYGKNSKNQLVQVAQYYWQGTLKAQHTRTADKDFAWIGNTERMELFGQHLFRSGGKRIYIIEGEIDCMTVAQILGHSFPVVSVPNGAQSAKRYLLQNIEYLESFAEIVLVFDNDEPDRFGKCAGQEAMQECATIFTPGKVRLVHLPMKDPNAMHLEGFDNELTTLLKEAKIYRPDGIISFADLLVEDLEKDEELTGFTLPYPKLQKLLRGSRRGEITTLTAGSGMGKTTLGRELIYNFTINGLKCGYVGLEENVKTSAIGLIAVHNNTPFGELYLDRKLITPEQWRAGHAAFRNMYLYDHFGSLESSNLLSKLRYLAVGCGCDVILLDHISIAISGITEGEERRIIDNLMTNLRSMVENTGVSFICISHLSNPLKGKPHEEGGRIFANQLRGSGSIKQLSNNIVAVEGNQQGAECNLRLLRVLKNRLFGTVGVADTLLYRQSTGRLEVSDAVYNVGTERDF